MRLSEESGDNIFTPACWRMQSVPFMALKFQVRTGTRPRNRRAQRPRQCLYNAHTMYGYNLCSFLLCSVYDGLYSRLLLIGGGSESRGRKWWAPSVHGTRLRSELCTQRMGPLCGAVWIARRGLYAVVPTPWSLRRAVRGLTSFLA